MKEKEREREKPREKPRERERESSGGRVDSVTRALRTHPSSVAAAVTYQLLVGSPALTKNKTGNDIGIQAQSACDEEGHYIESGARHVGRHGAEKSGGKVQIKPKSRTPFANVILAYTVGHRRRDIVVDYLWGRSRHLSIAFRAWAGRDVDHRAGQPLGDPAYDGLHLGLPLATSVGFSELQETPTGANLKEAATPVVDVRCGRIRSCRGGELECAEVGQGIRPLPLAPLRPEAEDQRSASPCGRDDHDNDDDNDGKFDHYAAAPWGVCLFSNAGSSGSYLRTGFGCVGR